MNVRVRWSGGRVPRPVRASHVSAPVRMVFENRRETTVAVLAGVVSVLACALGVIGVAVFS